MSTVTPMPKFAGASALSLTHLQRMADAITHLRDGVAAAPAPQSRAAAVPGMAFYLPPEVNFTAEEQTYTEDWNEPGLVQGVMCVGRQHAPTIVEGVVRLPFAQTTWADDVSGATPGVVYAAAFEQVEAPRIEQGVVVLPYANSDGCEGVATPGVIADVRIDPDAVDPSIESGVLILPPSDGLAGIEYCQPSQGWGVTDGVAHVPLCHDDVCDGVAGVVSGVEVDGWSETPSLRNGVVRLPFSPFGMVDESGKLHSWTALRYAGGLVRMDSGDASRLGYSVQVTSAGGLKLYIDRA